MMEQSPILTLDAYYPLSLVLPYLRYDVIPLEGTYHIHLGEPWFCDINRFYLEMANGPSSLRPAPAQHEAKVHAMLG